MSLDLSWADYHELGLSWIRLGSYGLGLTYLFSPFHYPLGRKIICNVNNCSPHTICPMGHVCMYESFLYVKKGFLSFAPLIFIMRPKVQLTPLDVDY